MPSNVQIKAVVNNIEKLKTIAAKLSQSSGTLHELEETFYNCYYGKLKLKVSKGKPSKLIQYTRADETGPRRSDYSFTEIPNPDDLKVTLGKSLGVLGQVRKHRIVYMVGQTWVHVDQVEGLGDFMELEVRLKEGQSTEECKEIADDLMTQLGVKHSDLLAGAYIDMILKKKVQNETGDQ
jgi:predicted adenylyl cyclase CyaB